MDHAIHGWNECLVTYLLAAAAPRHASDPVIYHRGFASGRDFVNGNSYYGTLLPLGPAYGGPLFFAHYSFCGIDPRGLKDRYADYWRQNLHHVRINHEHCVRNPLHHPGYGAACWGLTASDDPAGYAAHSPENDNGTISPTAALSSMPYAPREALAAIRHFLQQGDALWGPYGFVDASGTPQVQLIRTPLERLMQGWTVGRAIDSFTTAWSSISAMLEKDPPTVQAVALKTHIARDDARNYVALGDPAVRLRVKDDSN